LISLLLVWLPGCRDFFACFFSVVHGWDAFAISGKLYLWIARHCFILFAAIYKDILAPNYLAIQFEGESAWNALVGGGILRLNLFAFRLCSCLVSSIARTAQSKSYISSEQAFGFHLDQNHCS
jgi:hypothetical protein